MEPDRGQVQLPDQHMEPVGEVLGPNRPPVGVGEHRPPAPPARTGADAGIAATLVGELVPEQFDGLPDGAIGQPAGASLVQGDSPDTGAAFRRATVQLPLAARQAAC